MRSLEREADVRAMLEQSGAEPGDALCSPTADLLSDAGLARGRGRLRLIALHVASPFPARQPRNEFELIVPARQGALRVLRRRATRV